MKYKNILIFVLLITLVLSCNGGLSEYKVLVNYGSYVCSDKKFDEPCDGNISKSERNVIYKYKLPSDVKTRIDARIYFLLKAEMLCPECKDHKFLLKDSLMGRNRQEDYPLIRKLQVDMKRMDIYDPKPLQ